MAIVFTVPGIPVAQPRQRHRVVNGHAQNYTPAKHPVNAFKAAAQLAASLAYKGAPLDCPLRVDMTFVMPRPKGMIWKKKPMPRYPHTGKPDRDNLIKSTQDALNGLVWRDDALIYAGNIVKMVAAGDEQPHVVVTIQPAATGVKG